MSARHSFPFDPTPAEQYDAATAAFKSLRKPVWRWGTLANVLLQAILMTAGTIGVVTLMTRDMNQGHLLVIAAMVVPFLSICIFPVRDYIAMFQQANQTRHMDGLTITFDKTGIELTNGRSHWTTSWEDVHRIVATKKTIAAVAGGIALFVPRRVVRDPEALLTDLHAWHGAAR